MPYFFWHVLTEFGTARILHLLLLNYLWLIQIAADLIRPLRVEALIRLERRRRPRRRVHPHPHLQGRRAALPLIVIIFQIALIFNIASSMHTILAINSDTADSTRRRLVRGGRRMPLSHWPDRWLAWELAVDVLVHILVLAAAWSDLVDVAVGGGVVIVILEECWWFGYLFGVILINILIKVRPFLLIVNLLLFTLLL